MFLGLSVADISIHAPVKGATTEWCEVILDLLDFNPRSREGSDVRPRPVAWLHVISIHAPVKGATSHMAGLVAFQAISIHAPVKGATCVAPVQVGNDPDFNPRSREGSDAQYCRSGTMPKHFNPRSREGSDLPHDHSSAKRVDFNPRSREGSDAAMAFHPDITPNFNPRSREGSDIRILWHRFAI